MMKTSSTSSHDEKLVERVRLALDQIPGVIEKKMFGSVAFMVRGKMCITARADRIMCRIDPALHGAAVKRKGCRTVFMGGREYRGYVFVDAEAIRTARALSYWVDLALDFNKAKKAGRKPGRER